MPRGAKGVLAHACSERTRSPSRVNEATRRSSSRERRRAASSWAARTILSNSTARRLDDAGGLALERALEPLDLAALDVGEPARRSGRSPRPPRGRCARAARARGAAGGRHLVQRVPALARRAPRGRPSRRRSPAWRRAVPRRGAGRRSPSAPASRRAIASISWRDPPLDLRERSRCRSSSRVDLAWSSV